MAEPKADFVFCALGGLGEIGMNAALYGYGLPHKREWILVDCGVSFAGPELPGIDLVLPDLKFLEGVKKNLKAIIITHAHEDHIGALMDLYPRLGKPPVYATRFAGGLFDIRRQNDPMQKRIALTLMEPGDRLPLDPFDVRSFRWRTRFLNPRLWPFGRRLEQSFIQATGRLMKRRLPVGKRMMRV